MENRTTNVIFEEASFIVCTLSNSGKGKAGNFILPRQIKIAREYKCGAMRT